MALQVATDHDDERRRRCTRRDVRWMKKVEEIIVAAARGSYDRSIVERRKWKEEKQSCAIHLGSVESCRKRKR